MFTLQATKLEKRNMRIYDIYNKGVILIRIIVLCETHQYDRPIVFKGMIVL